MLHEDDDPLSSSMFDTATSSLLGNTMTTSMFSSQYEQDPWGNHAVVSSPTDMDRSYTAPTLDYNSNYSNFPSNNDQPALNSTTVLCKFFFFFVWIL